MSFKSGRRVLPAKQYLNPLSLEDKFTRKEKYCPQQAISIKNTSEVLMKTTQIQHYLYSNSSITNVGKLRGNILKDWKVLTFKS